MQQNQAQAPESQELAYAVIGAGPSGLAAARNLQRRGLAWTGYEQAAGVGGLWDIDAEHSTVYESAHLISSKTTTEFTEFPMADAVADYPEPPRAARLLRRLRRPLRPARGLPVPDQGDPRRARRRPVAGHQHRSGGHPDRPARRRPGRQRHPQRADRAHLPRSLRRRGAAHQRLQAGPGLRRQAGAGDRRGQLRLRHRRRRRAPRRLGRPQCAARLLLRAQVPLRPPLRHAQPGQARCPRGSSRRSTPGC